MKSAALSELVPQWTEFVVTDLSGRDPLGLARVANNLTDHLMPGIVVATDRARYFALYSWILWNIQRTEKATTDAMFVEAFQRRESAFAIATLLQDPNSSPVGKRAVSRQIERADSEVRTAFKVLPSQDLGGYGQYYAGSLYKLGITHRPEGEYDQVTGGRGLRLAEAVERTIRDTKWCRANSYRKARNNFEVLTASSDHLTLDAIHQAFASHERSALIDIFFGLDSEEATVASLRRQSLARLLHLTRLYKDNRIALGPSDDVTLDDQLLLGPVYFGTLVNSKGKAAQQYAPPAFLASCNAMWRQFCLHEILSWSVESILSALLSVLAESPGGALSIEDVVEAISGAEFVKAVESYSGLKAATPHALFAKLGLKEPPTAESCEKARLRFSLKGKLNEDVVIRSEAGTPAEILAQALVCLALVYSKWREASDDAAWRAVRTMAGPELAVTSVLPRLDTWFAPNYGWPTCVQALMELVLMHHDRVMYEKGRLEACWVHRETDRLVLDQDYAPTYPPHNSRQASASSILFDLGLVFCDEDQQYSPTKEGDQVFLRARELGQ